MYSRRKFIKVSTIAGAGSLLFYHCKKDGLSSGKKVIVIGAGMAGASAAYHLRNGGHEVVLLEARDRIGGRIHTDETKGYPLEFGANWIHYPDGNPLTPLAVKYGAYGHETSINSIDLYRLDGSKANKFGVLEMLGRYSEAEERGITYANHLPEDIPWSEAFARFIDPAGFSEEQFEYYSWINNLFKTSYAEESDQLSAKNYWRGKFFGGVDFLVTGGYNKIVKGLLGDTEVRLNEKVVSVDQSSGRVKISTDMGIYEGDLCVVTVPLSILQQEKILFTPVLSTEKKTSINKVRLGLMNKIIMEFEEPFWSTNAQFVANTQFGNEDSYDYVLDWNYYEQKPVLVTFATADFGKKMETLDIGEVQNYWLDRFHKAFPGKSIDFKSIQTSGWWKDEFSHGSYSNLVLGSSQDDIDMIAEPHGKVFFAGEATERNYYSYVHGAYLSGLREANRINKM